MTEPLVIVPGMATDAAAWEGMPAGLVLSLDAPTINEIAREVLRRAPERFALAGHSMGGYVALKIIELAPERVTRLALLSTSARRDSAQQAERRRALVDLARSDYESVIGTISRAMLAPRNRSDPALVTGNAEMMRRCGAERFIRQQHAVMEREDMNRVLEYIAVPTLVLTGAEDAVVHPAESAHLAERIASAALVTLDAGHMPQLEAPDAARSALASWLARPVG